MRAEPSMLLPPYPFDGDILWGEGIFETVFAGELRKPSGSGWSQMEEAVALRAEPSMLLPPYPSDGDILWDTSIPQNVSAVWVFAAKC